MKKLNILLSASFMVVTILLFSCKKDEPTNVLANLENIVGTYNGTLTNSSGLKSSNSAIAIVSKTNNNQLQIHCYGDLMDTTLIMNGFENGDSIMLCDTGSNFEHEYGHMGMGNHMMDMDDSETEWQHHMNDDHRDSDMHYGGFDMNNHSFSYKFKMMMDSVPYYLEFMGSK